MTDCQRTFDAKITIKPFFFRGDVTSSKRRQMVNAVFQDIDAMLEELYSGVVSPMDELPSDEDELVLIGKNPYLKWLITTTVKGARAATACRPLRCNLPYSLAENY